MNTQTQTQTELLKEIEKLSKKGLALSKKAFCGSEHSSVYSGRLSYVYDRIWKLKAQLNNQ
jgi:hypothetical protein